MTNGDFLGLMFANRPAGALPRVAAFALPPGEADRRDWFGWAVSSPRGVPAGDRNTYCTVSTFFAGNDGKHRRRKDTFAAMHAVMIDDVGVKVAERMIVLPATVRIETSPGNCQDWLRLDPPITDRALAERLVDKMIAAGLTADGRDPGMKGVTRYGRLPEGVNTKPRPSGPWRHRVLEVRTDHAYAASEVAEAYGLELAPVPTTPHRTCVDPRALPDALAWFRALGLYQAPLAGGWHAITCPWVDEHSAGVDSGSAYREPAPENGYFGGFRCHHGHCEHRGIKDVFRWLQLRRQEAMAA